jgi:hypothetical protein
MIWGSDHQARDLGLMKVQRCDACAQDQTFKLRLEYRRNHLWFVLTWVSHKRYLSVCNVCHQGRMLDARRVEAVLPTHPIPWWTRWGGVTVVGLFALAMAAVSLGLKL